MRIAVIAEVFLPKVDGVVIRTMNLLRCLQEQGDEVLVICPQADGRRDCPVPVVEFFSYSFPPYPEYRIGIPDRRLIREVEQFAPDVLHYLNPFAFGFRCSDILERSQLRIPSVYSFHTLYAEFAKKYTVLQPLPPLVWWLTRHYHNRADLNLTVSSIMQEELKARGFERVELWPPAVDSTMFCPERRTSEMRERLSGGRPDRPLLITVSRLAPEKNVDFLVDVMKRLPEAQLAVVGDGPQRAELEQRFAGTATNFFGYLKGEQLAEAYASSDAFVYSSETETMGNVVLEAMACGLGVIAPRAGGIPSLVSHGEDGFLFAPGDQEAATEHVRSLLEDVAMRESLGRAAREKVRVWSWEKGAETVRGHYRRTIEEYHAKERSPARLGVLPPLTIATLVTVFRAAAWSYETLTRKQPPKLPAQARPESVQPTRR